MAELITFLGPTLSADEARALAPCEVRPPARQGDVWRALLDRPRAIALIDGVFESQPSVWHQEIRAALASGVAVFGASSMGALRAAELAPFGMVGVGEIFEDYRSGRRVDDGDVALLHADAEHAFQPLTVPLVDVEHAVALAQKAKVVKRREAKHLLERAKELHYTERRWPSVVNVLSDASRGRFLHFLQTQPVDLKAKDARSCLKAAAEFVRARAPAPHAPLPTFASHVRRARLMATQVVGQGESVEGEEADQGTRTLLLARLARSLGLSPSSTRVQQELRQLPKEGWAEDERRAAAEQRALERLLLDAPERVFPDGPARVEGLALARRARGAASAMLEDDRLRIVSYNVRYFSHALKGLASTALSKARIGEALSSLRPLPELICLQEVEKRSFRSGVAHRGVGAETQLEAFMRHLRTGFRKEGLRPPYAAYYFPAHTYGSGRFRVYTTGLAVLVNQERLHVLSHNQEDPRNITHYGGAPIKRVKQTRIVAHLHLEDQKGHRFHLFNTHLSLPSPFRSDFWKRKERMGHGANQLEEARAVALFTRERAGEEPFVLTGDFNAAPASPVYRYLTREAGLSGAQETLGHIEPENGGKFPTAGFLNLRMHLDHLFGAHVKWVDLEGTAHFDDPKGSFFGLSDHVPLIASFELDRR